MEGITVRGGQLINQSLIMLNYKGLSGYCLTSRWTKWWWARISDRGTTNTCSAVTCVKMDSSEKGKILCVNHWECRRGAG